VPPPDYDEVMRLQREANQMLLLAGLRAHEEIDDARVTADFRELLIGILGHDLRNPLNTVIMASGLLLAHGALADDDVSLVNRIISSGHRMARMIGQLSNFTRARLGGGFELKLAPSNLGEICREITEELRISSSAEIVLTIDPELEGSWDADRLAEAISNIAGNALDHATPGTPVVIHAHDDAGGAVVEITNQGACIPPDLLPLIFKAFRRADANATKDTGHMGLGLYIANEIVRTHGGTLDVRSSDGSTTFTLRLPRAS